ncbi:MAG: LmbE family protein, partial [Bacteroidota bacterium]
GVNITWTRLKGGEKVRPLVERAIQEFNPENPAAIVPLLFQIRTAIGGLENSVWKRRKYQETEQLIQECLGLFIEATAGHYQSSPGEKIRINLEIINRSGAEVQVNEISAKGVTWDTTFTQVLRPNVALQLKTYASVDPHRAYSDPYWLTEPHSLGLFTVKNPDYIGLPQNPPAAEFVFSVQVGQEKMQITRPLIYKWVDNVKGEWWRPFEIVPPVFVNLQDKVIIFNNGQPREVKIVVRGAGDRLLKGELKLSLPAGWKCEPASIPIELMKKNEELTKSFQLYPSATEATTTIKAFVETEGKVYDQSIQLINYDHIPIQTLLPKAEVKAVRLDLKKEGNLVAYIKGAGDEIPSALRNIGYEVWEMKNEEVTLQNLKRADAVVLGVRALNANERIRYIMPSLLEYVKTGGTLVVQYNTNFDMETDAFSPYPLKLSRERVTQEDAEVRILKPDHALLNAPNKITPRDFEGWVQERGLYYPSTWDPNFEALLSMNDKGETPKDGSLLVAKYGEGHYIYTGLSFFRELPEGVAGAYKLFANAISLGRSKKTDNAKTKNKTK